MCEPPSNRYSLCWKIRGHFGGHKLRTYNKIDYVEAMSRVYATFLWIKKVFFFRWLCDNFSMRSTSWCNALAISPMNILADHMTCYISLSLFVFGTLHWHLFWVCLLLLLVIRLFLCCIFSSDDEIVFVAECHITAHRIARVIRGCAAACRG